MDSDGKEIIGKTGQLTGFHKFDEVKNVIVKSLKQLGKEVPDYL